MPQSVLEMAKDLVLAQIRSGTLAPEEMQEALRLTPMLHCITDLLSPANT